MHHFRQGRRGDRRANRFGNRFKIGFGLARPCHAIKDESVKTTRADGVNHRICGELLRCV